MILHDLHIKGKQGLQHIRIEHGRIKTITADRRMLDDVDTKRYELGGAIAFPGFINSHDHLDFNLYPALGNRIYNNYREWGADIHIADNDIIQQVKKVPLALRIQWGLYKNLLNGFTTVVNHGNKLLIEDDLITVLQDNYDLHSPGFERNWKWKLNNPFRRPAFIVMHIGEGTDEISVSEINSVIRNNFLRRKMVAVHGVAMNAEQASSFAGLVWCPASNLFLLNKTAAIDVLKNKTRVVFGTDSTLTAAWNLWEHFRLAKQTGMVNDEELMNMLTATPAALWGLKNTGSIEENKTADIVVVKNTGDSFTKLNPADIEMVIHRGNIRVSSQAIEGFYETGITGTNKWVQGNLPGLFDEINNIIGQTPQPPRYLKNK